MGSCSCFLIDDDEDDREIFTLALKKAEADFVCSTARNGKEAIEKALAGNFVPNYIFIDLNMPLVSGRECLRALRKIERFKNVPMIVYTTSSFSKDIREVRDLGATHYLVKPTSFSALVHILTELFNEQNLPFFLTSGVNAGH